MSRRRSALASAALAGSALLGGACIFLESYDPPVPDGTGGGSASGSGAGFATSTSGTAPASSGTGGKSSASSSTSGNGGAAASSSTAAGTGGGSSSVAASTSSGSGVGGAASAGALWATRFGGVNDDGGNAVATDAMGNVYVVGSFQGTTTFGGGMVTSAGGADAFLAEYAPDGTFVRDRTWGDAKDQLAFAVALDAAGDVYVAGTFEGTMDFGGAAYTITATGLQDVFLAKLTSAGAPLWARDYRGVTSQDFVSLNGRGLAVDAAGNATLAGSLHGTVNLGLGPITSAGAGDVFVARIDPAGNTVWAKGFGDTSDQLARAVALGPGGVVAVTGTTEGTLDFGGCPATSQGGGDAFVAVLDGSGACVWNEVFGDPFPQDGRDVAVDASGDVWAAGSFQGTLAFGGACSTVTAPGSFAEAFLVRLGPTGACVGARRYGDGSAPGAFARALAIDASGDVLVAGDFAGNIDFGAGPTGAGGVPAVFVAKLSPAFAPVYGRHWGGAGAQTAAGVAADTMMDAFVTGQMHGTVAFGPTVLTSAGGGDGFLVKVGP